MSSRVTGPRRVAQNHGVSGVCKLQQAVGDTKIGSVQVLASDLNGFGIGVHAEDRLFEDLSACGGKGDRGQPPGEAVRRAREKAPASARGIADFDGEYVVRGVQSRLQHEIQEAVDQRGRSVEDPMRLSLRRIEARLIGPA